MDEKILVGLDDSVESWNAFNYAVLEAKRKRLDSITVMHSKERSDAQEYRKGEEILEEAEERGAEEGVEVKTELLMRGQEPDVDIVKFAEEKDYDHIIVGHKGRSGISGALLGSVAEGVVENANCAVTVMRAAPYIQRDGKRIKAKIIENLLEEHVGVEKSAVIGVKDEILGEKIIAFFAPTEGYEPTEEMLKEFMQQFVEEGKIENFAIPDEIKMLEKLPQKKAGTVDKDTLRDEYT